MADTFDYNALDAFKRRAITAARSTAGNIGFGFRECEESRGESAYLIDMGGAFLALVEEGLGTKNLVAEHMQAAGRGVSFSGIAYDTVAMIVNDLITVGAQPLAVAMHLAIGSDDWFRAEHRVDEIIEGWKRACNDAGCAWGPGETPKLADIVNPKSAVLSGSAIGFVEEQHLMLGRNIEAGDRIVLLASSGIHANGLTNARRVARELEKGYDTLLVDGLTYGEWLLKPTHIYAKFVAECQRRGVDLHYGVNITGHGWRKLMRAPQPFRYRIDVRPEVPEIFRFLQSRNGFTDRQMYGDYNMGAGFALFLPPGELAKLPGIVSDLRLPYGVLDAGCIEACDHRRVDIRDMGTFVEADLDIR